MANDSARDWYLSRINAVKPADRHTNLELLKRYRFAGDKKALEELIATNLGLVFKWARKYQAGTTSSLHDLMQLGLIGMVRAADTFDFDMGTAFSTYAVPSIIQDMRNYHSDNYIVKIPRDASQLNQIIHVAVEAAGVTPDDVNWPAIKAEVDKRGTTQSKRVSLTTLKNYRYMPHAYSYDAFDSEHADDPMKASGEDRASAKAFNMVDENFDDTVAHAQLATHLDLAISKLTDREQDIIRKYYQMEKTGEDAEHSCESIGRLFGVTRERIRQIKEKALRQMRQSMEAAGLTMRDFA